MSVNNFLALAATVLLAFPVIAQPTEAGRGVARISLLNGDVSVRRGDSGDYVAAALNAPLVVQDRVVTGKGARAELQFDSANFLRLAQDTEVEMADLQFERYIVQIARGTIIWRVLRDQEASVEISTPAVSVRPVRRGVYRVTVLYDGSCQITVRSGEAEIFTPQGSERLQSGRTMFARGTAAQPEFRIGGEIETDSWDRWNEVRDRELESSRSYQYMSRDIYGGEDLDAHGQWVNVSSYGWVWSPRVAAGWAPYRYGRWSWMDWYGWTWISHDPWGWAPYHYGRWFWHAPVGWCWWPGSFGVRHYWSPGIVAFVGFGGAGVGVGWGRVGWLPLGPREPFYPWWGRRWYGGYRNPGYFGNNMTVVNNVNITNIYRNSRIQNAVTVVDQDGFRRGRFHDSFRAAGTDEFRNVSVARGPVPVSPGRESLRMVDREAAVRGVERTGAERFFSRSRPAQVDRVSFEDQQRGIDQIARRNGVDSGGRGFARSGDSGLNSEPGQGAGGRSQVDVAQSGASSGQRGWRRVGQAPQAADSPDSDRSPGRSTVDRDDGAGFRRFGTPRTAESNSGGPQTVERSAGRGDVDGNSGDGGWRRFGSPRVSGNSDGRTEPGTGRSFDNADRDWRRFGAGSTAPSGGNVDNPTRGSDSDWRRFGSPRSPGNSDVRTEPGTGRSLDNPNGDWRRFGGGTGEAGGRSFGGSADRSEPRSFGGRSLDGGSSDSGRRFSGDRPASRSFEGSRGFSGAERPNFGGSRGGNGSIQISPPIVRERSTGGGRSFDGPRSSPGGGGMRGGGGGGRSAPSGGGAGRSGGGGGSRRGR